MKTSPAAALLLAFGLTLPVPAEAGPRFMMEADNGVVLAQVDCYSVGRQVASRNGGTLARATPQDQGGQTVCVIVVLMPAKDGQRPRRAEFVVPPG